MSFNLLKNESNKDFIYFHLKKKLKIIQITKNINKLIIYLFLNEVARLKQMNQIKHNAKFYLLEKIWLFNLIS